MQLGACGAAGEDKLGGRYLVAPLKGLEFSVCYSGYIGIMKKKMETTI